MVKKIKSDRRTTCCVCGGFIDIGDEIVLAWGEVQCMNCVDEEEE